MNLADLKKKKAGKVIGLDCSTFSLAYAIYDNGQPVECGEVFFDGADIYERLNNAREKTQELVDKGILVGDYVAMESAVMVNNREVVIKLAYVFGAVLSVLMQNKMQVVTVKPLEWQCYIGNPVLNKAEKEKMKLDYPNKPKTWYSAKGREIRKQRTLDWAKQFFTIETDSDNVGDACGVAFYTSEALTRR